MTEAQREAKEAYEKAGTVRGAARALGKDPKTIRKHLQKAGVLKPQAKPALAAPDGMRVNQLTTLVRNTPDEQARTGQVLQWVRHKEGVPTVEQIAESLYELTRPIAGKSKLLKPSFAEYDPDHMPMVMLGDPHFGLRSYEPETGADFDLEICERVTGQACEKLIGRTQPCEKMVLVSVGDTTHADGAKPLTPASGNVLDVDSRFTHVFDVTLRSFKHVIECGLDHHRTVDVYIVPGNHDPTIGYMLSYCLREYYSNNDRVMISTDPTARRYIRWGDNLVGLAHGDRTKREKLPLLMATERADDWGETKNRMWFTGHIHHRVAEDFMQVSVESLRTLAEPDAWHVESGYLSIKDARSVVLNRRFGEVERYTVSKMQIDSGS